MVKLKFYVFVFMPTLICYGDNSNTKLFTRFTHTLAAQIFQTDTFSIYRVTYCKLFTKLISY